MVATGVVMRVANVLPLHRSTFFRKRLCLKVLCPRRPRFSSCIHTTGCLQRGENVPSGEKEHISYLSDARSTWRESDAEGWTIMPLAEEAVEDIIPEPQVSAIERKWIEKMKQRQDLLKADTDNATKFRLKDRLRKKKLEARRLRRKFVSKKYGGNKGREGSEVFSSERVDTRRGTTETEDDTLDVY